MHIVLVSIRVTPENTDKFLEATRENVRATLMEPGVVRFDLLRQTDDSTRFLLFEVYRGPEDQNYHKQTPHYKRWTEIAEPMLAEPRTRIYYQSALPGESGWE